LRSDVFTPLFIIIARNENCLKLSQPTFVCASLYKTGPNKSDELPKRLVKACCLSDFTPDGSYERACQPPKHHYSKMEVRKMEYKPVSRRDLTLIARLEALDR